MRYLANIRRAIGTAGRILRARDGVTSAEYAILGVGIVIVVGGAVFVLDNPLNSALRFAGSFLNSSQVALSSAPPSP